MRLLDKLFRKTPSAKDIRVHLKEVEREQRKKRLALDALAQNKQLKVQDAISAKKAGRQEKLRDIFRETRQLEIDYRLINNDLRRLSLEKIALTSLLRKVGMLEKAKDRKSLQKLVARFKESSIQNAIDHASVDDDTFQGMLEEILEEQDPSAQRAAREDPGFAAFDRAIEEMAKADGSGDLPDAALEPVKSFEGKAVGRGRAAGEPARQQVRGGSGYDCAHCPFPPKEAVSGKRCRYCKNLLCETCHEESCPYICGTCAHCGQHFTEQTKKGSCDYCYNLICTECGRPCHNPRYVCFHCKRGIGRGESNEECSKCGNLIHSEHRTACPYDWR